MKRLITTLASAAAALVLAIPAAWAAEEPAAAAPPEAKQASPQKFVRQESLELPGLTACHQCEWRPRLHEQAAGPQCGFTPEGKAKIGQFECGFSPDCDRVCIFLSCIQ